MKFVIIAPPKNLKSAGCMFLYNFADEIRATGYEAVRIILAQNRNGDFFVSCDEKNFVPLEPDTLEKIVDPSESIVIHGENLHHKFFDKFNVARFYLNKIGSLRNIGVPRPNEYKIAWNPSFVDKPDFILRRPVTKKPEKEILQLNQSRLIDLTYVGKGHLYDANFGRLPSTLELTRDWPKNVDEYLYLLSKTRFLFTYDVKTAVVEEAVFYGAVPVIMTHLPMSNMEDVKGAYNVELKNCCLLFEEFEKLNADNVQEFFDNFYFHRKKFITYLEQQEIDYRERLVELIESILERFSMIPNEPMEPASSSLNPVFS
ncbi:hypothetical protein N9Y31_02955 [Alphaproteobacteria bacterium]|nr:hypothetical protein [Alphaproteobacteria bacterium]